MGSLRLLRFGIRYSFRSRRIVIFIFFFIVLSGVTAFSLNEISREDRDLLLKQRAIIFEQNDFDQNTLTDANPIISEFEDRAQTIVVAVRYITLPTINTRLFSASVAIPWGNPIVQPDNILQGHYLQATEKINSAPETWEVIVSEGFIDSSPLSGSTELSNLITLGTTLNFTDSTSSPSELHLKSVGTFEKPETSGTPANEIWMIVAEAGFEKLLDLLGRDPVTEVFYYQIVIISEGFSETVAAAIAGDAKVVTELNKVEAISLINDPLNSANWHFRVPPPDLNDILNDVTNTDIILLLGSVGAPIVATSYAFIISRFRTREIAIMKAVGYSDRSVQIMLLSEILTVSIIGFVLSILGLQFILSINAVAVNTTFVPNIWNPLNFSNGLASMLPSPTAILTFIFVVLSNVLGFIIIFKKTASVTPVELFRSI